MYGFYKDVTFVCVSFISVSAIVTGTLGSYDNYNEIWIVAAFVANSAFGSVLSQFGKHIEPSTQIIIVNTSLIPLASWLSIEQLGQPDFSLFTRTSTTTWMSEWSST